MKVRALLAAGALVVAAPTAALAVWGGEPDGDDHPWVGAFFFDFDESGTINGNDLICSGSYAGTHFDHDVFLTAGHCLPPPDEGIPPEALSVSFDPDVSDGVASLIAVEEFHGMPGIGHDRGDLRDLGVILLPPGSVDVAFDSPPPVQLPPEGHLDDLKREGQLRFRTVDIVGYGVTPVWDMAGPTTFEYDGIRKAGTSIITGLLPAHVVYNQNPHGIGTGSGVCYGDSGAPQLDLDTLTVMSVTSGGNGQCHASNVNYRVDTPAAREFLEQFIELP